MKDSSWTWMEEWVSRFDPCWLTIIITISTQAKPGTKIQMQLNWQHVKMLDQSVKSQQSGYKCNGSLPYDTCMYRAVIKVIQSRRYVDERPFARPWPQPPSPTAPSPGCLATRPSAPLTMTEMPASGLIIIGSPTNREDEMMENIEVKNNIAGWLSQSLCISLSECWWSKQRGAT